MKKVVVLVGAILLAGCNAVPEKLAVPERVSLLPYSAAIKQSQNQLSQQARWGGKITAVENREESTVIDVLHYELSNSGKPQASDQSAGRFRIYMQGFLDPAIYEQGRMVTVLGKLAPHEQVLVGSHPLKHPVIYGQELHLWPIQKETEKEVVYVPYVIRTPIYIPRR